MGLGIEDLSREGLRVLRVRMWAMGLKRRVVAIRVVVRVRVRVMSVMVMVRDILGRGQWGVVEGKGEVGMVGGVGGGVGRVERGWVWLVGLREVG